MTNEQPEVQPEVSSNIITLSLSANQNNNKYTDHNEYPKERKLQIRSTFFTLNNPTEEEEKLLIATITSNIDTRYLVYQLEAGDEKQTEHFQGFMYFFNKITLGTLNDLFPRMALFKPRCIKACILYCKKKNTSIRGPYEYGKMPEQGRRTDLESVAQKYLTLSVIDFVKEAPTEYIRYHRGLQALKQATIVHRDPNTPPRVVWHWGPAGSNKTRTAYDRHIGSVYVKDGSQWWDGYEQQEAIIIDDFDGKWPYRDLLRLLDRYPYQGQIKGGFVKITSPFIYITCEDPPEHFWIDNKLAQITRRINEIIRFGEYN